jgi:hypothetical protein
MTAPEKDGWKMSLLLELGKLLLGAGGIYMFVQIIRAAVWFGANQLEACFSVLMVFLFFLLQLWEKITKEREIARLNKLDEILENQRELSAQQQLQRY